MSIWVGILVVGSGEREFAISPKKSKNDTEKYFRDCGSTVVGVIEMPESSPMGELVPDILRTMAGTSEGAETLGKLLAIVAKYQRDLQSD